MVDWFGQHVKARVADSRMKWIHGQLSSKTRKGKVDMEIMEKIEEWVGNDLMADADSSVDPVISD